MDRQYTLPELADAADVTPRTIRYYISQGLLPAPITVGAGARYSAGHLARLRLIRELQRQHLPLAEIRARLEGLPDAEIVTLLRSVERPLAATSATEYIRSLLAPVPRRSDVVPPLPAARAMAPEPARAPYPPSPGIRESAAAYGDAAATAQPRATPPPLPAATRSQWERVVLSPDLELHIRRPLSRLQNRAVDRLVASARQILEEETS